MNRLCWHKYSNWSNPIQSYKGNLQQWRYCSKCNKSDFRNIRWHNQTELSTVINALETLKENITNGAN